MLNVKKILLSVFILFNVLFLNISNVYCTTYSSSNIQYIYILVNQEDYNDSNFILNNNSNTLRIVDYYNDVVYKGTFYKKSEYDYSQGLYYYSYKLGENFVYEDDTNTRKYDIYIQDVNNIKMLQLLNIENPTDYKIYFTDFEEYTGEVVTPPTGDDDNNDDVNIDYDFNIIHTDLLVLIVLIGFYVFTKIIIIIVRNFSGGD